MPHQVPTRRRYVWGFSAFNNERGESQKRPAAAGGTGVWDTRKPLSALTLSHPPAN